MRVFYVRPSDNGNYGIEEALATLGRAPERVDLALFRGLRLPLEPLNFDPTEGGFANLNGYDLVILAGLDPIILSPQDSLALLAFVERGGGLMLVGGTHSFGNAEGTYLPLAVLLPAGILRGLDVEVNALPRSSDHPIARGLPEPMGYISKVHPIEPKPAAKTVMWVGDFPFVVAGEHGYGRVVVVAAYPECDATEYGWFFTGDAFDDFLRNAVAWMAKEQPPVWIEAFSLPGRRVATGSESFGKVLLHASHPTDVQMTTRLTRGSQVVSEESTRLHVEKTHEALFSFRIASDAAAHGVHYATVVVSDARGRELARRDVAVEVVNFTRASVELEYGRRCLLPSEPVRLRVHAVSERRTPPPHVTLDVAVLDSDGNAVHSAERRHLRWLGKAYDDTELELPVPRLRPGIYRVRAELRFGETVADAVEEGFRIVGRPMSHPRFPLIAEGGDHLDRASIERSVARLAAAGVNSLSLPGAVLRPWGEGAHWEAMLDCAAEQALRGGFSLTHHRQGLVPNLKPSAPLDPCALSTEFKTALDEHATPILAAAGRSPCLLFHELAPRSAVLEEQVCRCAACANAFRRHFGTEMPGQTAKDLPASARQSVHAFISSYWWHVYAAVRALRDEMAASVPLSLTFSAASFLREGPSASYCDTFSWVRACDVLEVASERDEGTYRLSLSGHRALCADVGKPFGALVDLSNKALPPAEAAYMALAHGADHLRVADNPRFLFWRRQPPLEVALGESFVHIGKAASLLAHSKALPVRVALLFPFTQLVDRGSEGLLAAHELLYAATGGVDLLHQWLARDDRLSAYAAVAVFGTRRLPRKTAAALAQYVERGGLLLADRADAIDESDNPLPWPDGFFGEEETPVFEAITRRRRAYGAGRTVLFSPDMATAYERAVQRKDVLAARALARAVGDALADHGFRPCARSSDPAVEVGLRVCDGTYLLVAVNHGDQPHETRVTLDGDVARAVCAYDLTSGEEQHVEGGEAPALTVRVPSRSGGIWALYTERPFSLRLELPEASARRGESLQYKVLIVNEAGRPVAGSHILRIFVTDPAGEERPDLGGERVTTNGVLEVAEPLAANERPGQWTICVTDVLTRRIARRTFELAGGEEAAPKAPPPEDKPGKTTNP